MDVHRSLGEAAPPQEKHITENHINDGKERSKNHRQLPLQAEEVVAVC